MLREGDKITNPRNGQVMIDLKTGAETNGQLLQIECFSPQTLEREPEHIHPFQENSFEIISGSCVFDADGKEQIVGPRNTEPYSYINKWIGTQRRNSVDKTTLGDTEYYL